MKNTMQKGNVQMRKKPVTHMALIVTDLRTLREKVAMLNKYIIFHLFRSRVRKWWIMTAQHVKIVRTGRRKLRTVCQTTQKV